MSRSGNNRTGLSEENKNLLLDSIIDGYNNNKIIVDIVNNIVLDTKHNVSIDLITGNWINSKAGHNKKNRRAYVEIKCTDKKVMCPDYTYVTIIRALISNNLDLIDLLRKGYIVNHKNGDVQDCREENLEVVNNTDNILHGAMLHCIKVYFPKHVEEYEYMNGIKEMTQNIFVNRDANVSVLMIKEFNEFIENDITCKAYKMKPFNTLKDRQKNYKELPNKATVSYFICWLRDNYNIDLALNEEIVDVVKRQQKIKEQDAYWKRQMTDKPVVKEEKVKDEIDDYFDF